MRPTFSAAERGAAHLCGHRGNKMHAPENTLSALRSVRAAGGSSAEIDIVLSSDGQIVVLHDLTVDRTTDGSGVAADMTLAELQALDAGSWMAPDFAGERLPTLAEAIAVAHEQDLVLEAEIKEKRDLPGMIAALQDALALPEDRERVMLISFDHASLLAAKKAIPGVKTGGILHERLGDPVNAAQAAELDELCIDWNVFHPDDARALHDSGIVIRCHAYSPARIAEAEQCGLNWRAELIAAMREGLIDTLSGDDVNWLADLVREAGVPAGHLPR